jgi:hypothetical protein
METKELQTVNKSVVSLDPEALIAKGIEHGLPIETMQKLLDMRTQLKAEYAREEFYKSLSKFQKECPEIKKTKIVYNKDGKTVRYKYAPLESIIEQVKEPLEANGFSYTIKTKQGEGYLTTICEAHHIAGHTESTEITVPISKDGYMADIQQVGSSMTYSKRYSFCNQWGIMTGDEDNDAVPAPSDNKISGDHFADSQIPDPSFVHPKTLHDPIKEGDAIPAWWWTVKKQNLKLAIECLPDGCEAFKITTGNWVCVRKGS